MDSIGCEQCETIVEWGDHWYPIVRQHWHPEGAGLSVLCGVCQEAQGRFAMRVRRECREEKEWEVVNEPTVQWDKEQSEYLRKKLERCIRE